MRAGALLFGTLLAVGTLLAIGCADPACDAGALQGSLDEATEGQVVDVGACLVVGDLVVPPGVTLRGAGAGSIIEAQDSVAVRVETRAGTTGRVEQLTLRSEGCAALAASGDGELTLEGLSVEVSRGIGIGVEGLASLQMTDVTITGPLDPMTEPMVVPAPPYACDTADPATHGLVVVGVTDAQLQDVSSRGFAAFGALLVESSTTWTGGAVEDHVGAGVEVFGGTAVLRDLTLAGARQSALPIEAVNGVFAGGASVSTERLTVQGGEVFGLFHDGADGTHVDLRAEDHGFAGVWSQDAGVLTLSGTATAVRANRFAGIATFGVGEVSVSDATIEGTTEGIRAGPAGAIRSADGLHLVDSPRATLARLSLRDNERVGLLSDLAGASTDALSISDVEVSGTGAQLGAIAQNGTVSAGWDTGVVRQGATATNDPAFSGVLDVAGVIGPSCLPDASGVVTAGLRDLVP